MNTQAEELNQVLSREHSTLYSFFSRKGQEIFFPKQGILAQSAAAKGKRINATIGEAVEDDGSPMSLSALKSEINIDASKAFPYAPSYGKPEIRKAWKDHLFKKNPGLAGKNISLPVATCGITHALSIAAYLFLEEGSELFIPDMYWENYNLIFNNWFNVKTVTYNLFKDGNMDMEALANVLSGSNRRISVLMNFPNNPTGYTPTDKEAAAIIKMVQESAERGNKVLVLLDDAYFGLVFEKDVYKESLFSSLAGLHENVLCVKMDGPTKEDYVWGFRVGFITYGIKGANEAVYGAVESKTGGAIRGNISNISNLAQSLLLEAYTRPGYDDEKTVKFSILEKRYRRVKEVLEQNPQYKEVFEPLPFNSGYFMCVRLKDGLDGNKIWKTLLDEFDTGLIHLNGLFRVAFSSLKDALIPELFENVYKAALKNR